MSGRLRPLAQLLVDSVGDRARPLPAGVLEVPVDAVVEAAGLHRVTPAVARHLARSGEPVPAPLAERLEMLRHVQLTRHLRAQADLAVLAGALDAAGIDWVAVKGPVAAALWPSPGMREYFDLDLVVDRHRLRDVLHVLETAGAGLVDRNWPLLQATMRAELALRGPYGTPVDLHWDIAVARDLRRAFTPDVPAMLGRRRRTRLGPGPAIAVLDPEDAAYHLAFHAAQAGANRLVWMADLHYAVRVPGFDWAQFWTRTRESGAGLPVATVLDRVRRTLGPDDDPTADGPLRGWRAEAARRDRRTPFPGLPGDPHLGGTVYAGARHGVLSSTASTVRSMALTRWTQWRVEGRESHRELRRDVPDARARRAYLQVAEGSRRP